MQYKLVITGTAEQDLEDIAGYIANDLSSPKAALAFLNAVDSCYGYKDSNLLVSRLLFLANLLDFSLRAIVLSHKHALAVLSKHIFDFSKLIGDSQSAFSKSKLHLANTARVQSSLYFANLFADKAKSGEIPACISSIFNAVCKQISK